MAHTRVTVGDNIPILEKPRPQIPMQRSIPSIACKLSSAGVCIVLAIPFFILWLALLAVLDG